MGTSGWVNGGEWVVGMGSLCVGGLMEVSGCGYVMDAGMFVEVSGSE